MTITWCRGWDLASTDKQLSKSDPDYTVGSKVGIQKIPSNIADVNIIKVYIDDVIIGRWEAPERDKIIISTAIADGSDTIVAAEAVAGYKDCYNILRTVLKGIVSVRQYKGIGDKVAKASHLLTPFEAGNVYMRKANWNEVVVKQLREFPRSSHDDIVDSLAIASSIAINCSATLIYTGAEYSEEQEYIRGVLIGIKDSAEQLKSIGCQQEAYIKYIRNYLLKLQSYYLENNKVALYNHCKAEQIRLDLQFHYNSYKII